jgi:hypothetical protein
VGLFTHRDMLKGFINKGACYSPLPGLTMARRNRGSIGLCGIRRDGGAPGTQLRRVWFCGVSLR